MFTGIITHTGIVSKKTSDALAIHVGRDVMRGLKKGDSVAVDGVCLTVARKTASFFSADVMPETFKRTNLGTLKNRDLVNLELPATLQTFLSGHIVEGHVDAVGTIKEIKKNKNQFTLYVSIPRKFTSYVVSRGSIAVNGVSLTVIDVHSGVFSVGIIPHTWKSTMLRTLRPETLVNIEVDVLAKYVERFISNKKA